MPFSLPLPDSLGDLPGPPEAEDSKVIQILIWEGKIPALNHCVSSRHNQ